MEILQNALILAGGKSSRMGRDKTLLGYKNFPTITHFLFWRLSEIFKSVKISTKTAKFSPPLPLLIDEFSEFSPLKVIANLDKNYSKPVFIIAGDTPFVKNATIQNLAQNLQNNEISIAKSGDFIHFLCGFYDPAVSQKARNLLAQNRQKVGDLTKICATKISDFGDEKQFFNINTPKDYEKIL